MSKAKFEKLDERWGVQIEWADHETSFEIFVSEADAIKAINSMSLVLVTKDI